jgi:ElaB/YqjD/DUF883 family membrane-anchored ribosome-binding protein
MQVDPNGSASPKPLNFFPRGKANRRGNMNTDGTNATAENALKSTAESVGQLADKVQETVRQTQERLTELQRDLVDRTRVAAQSTDTYVHQKPWNAAMAALGIGFVVGLILGRR